MKRSFSSIVAGALLAFAIAVPAASSERPTTVLVVRHAERASEPKDDPPLDERGRARADALARVVSSSGVSVVVTSQYARTRETGAAVASKLALTPIVVPTAVNPATKEPTPDATRALVDEIAKHRGTTVLVVGHSNTIPALLAALGGPKDVVVGDTVFDDLFVVTIEGLGRATVVRLKYGP